MLIKSMMYMQRIYFLIVAIMAISPLIAQNHVFNQYHQEEALKKRVQKNDIDAMNQLGLLYLTDVFHKEKQAVELFSKASAKGHQNATYNLGACYFQGKGIDLDYGKALELFRQIADTDIFAQTIIGMCYLYGHGVEKDYDKAVSWLKKGSEGNKTNANLHLAYAYSKGLGVEKDESKALKLYSPFAEKGNLSAQYQMALIYYNGETVSRNCQQALYWFGKVANRYYDALTIMGEIYEKGECMPVNLAKAKDYYQQASDCGVPLAECRLGSLLYNEKNYEEAFIYFTQAAEDKKEPVAEAMRKLAACYRYGLGTTIDLEKEKYWMDQAANHNDYKAIDVLNEKITMNE